MLTLLVPWWAVLVRLLSGSSDATAVPIMTMGDHMQMTQRASTQPGDEARAVAIVTAAKRVVVRYADVRTAERDGYRLFHAEAVGGTEHYVSTAASASEGKRLDYERPGSLLYRRDAARKTIVGVMYGAPASATAAELDARAPLSVAPWHRHVDFCIGPSGDRRFGFQGTIHTQAACDAAKGYFLPLAFGWMTHVYPQASSPTAMWGGEDMRADGVQHNH